MLPKTSCFECNNMEPLQGDKVYLWGLFLSCQCCSIHSNEDQSFALNLPRTRNIA